MAKAIIAVGGGGGGSSDDVTALKSHVLSGYTAITKDSNDEVVGGTMANNPAQNASLNCGQSKTILAGYTPGGTITANSLASQTGGATATDEKVLAGNTYWKDGVKRTGTMPSVSIGGYTPSKTTQTIPCGGKHMENNIVVEAIPDKYFEKKTIYTIIPNFSISAYEYYDVPLSSYMPASTQFFSFKMQIIDVSSSFTSILIDTTIFLSRYIEEPWDDFGQCLMCENISVEYNEKTNVIRIHNDASIVAKTRVIMVGNVFF